MADDAGFAAALAVREKVLADALLFAYARASFSRQLTLPVLGSGPPASIDGFLAAPVVTCDGANNALVVSLTLTGALSITPQGGAQEVQGVVARLDVSIPPTFTLSQGQLALSPVTNTVTVTSWTFDVVFGSGYKPATDAYLRSVVFRDRLTLTIQFGLDHQLIPMPSVDVSFVGSEIINAAEATAPDHVTAQVPGRVLDGALAVGINIDGYQFQQGGTTITTTLVGDPNALRDFTGPYDLAAVTNAASVPIQLQSVTQDIVKAVGSDGTLGKLDMVAADGQFNVNGNASSSDGTATFSFSIVPQMVAIEPGAFFQFLKKPVSVKPRQWPGLSFSTADVHVSVDANLSFWDDVVLGIGTVLSFGVLLVSVLDMEDAIAHGYGLKIAGQTSGTPVNLVHRVSSAALDNVTLRIAVQSYQITPEGTFTGVTVTPEPLPAALVGPKQIRGDLATDPLRYSVRLPIDVVADDPQVFVQWTVIDPVSGTVYVDDDGVAKNRLTFTFTPSAVHPGLSTYAVGCRVYRKVGSALDDILNDGISLAVGPAIPTGAYLRWKYDVQRPWVQFDPKGDAWLYKGEPVAHRMSNIHRAHNGCQMVAKRSRYIYEQDVFDTLPFPVSEVDAHRKELCDYCFYGGPAGLRAIL